MYKYTIKFIALKETITFVVTSEAEAFVEQFSWELLSVFAPESHENEKITISLLQQNSSEVTQKIQNFTNKFKAKLPRLNSVAAFFRTLSEGERFFFLPNIEIGSFEILKLHDYLKAMSEGKDFDLVHTETKEIFEELFNKYHITVIGDTRISIGHPIKKERICRFCKKGSDDVTFNKKAHAISEALGNKNVVLYDECDTCNLKFSQTIEPDIIQYLALFRAVYDVKGKGGSKQFKGKNFEITNDGDLILSMSNSEDRPKDQTNSYLIKLETNEPIALQNIYKSLCKFYLSVLDLQYLHHFTKTLDWINGEYKVEKLPKIAEMISYHSFSLRPKKLFT